MGNFFTKAPVVPVVQQEPLEFSDFHIGKEIGSGAFGMVRLAECPSTARPNKVFAVKTVCKPEHFVHVSNELRVLHYLTRERCAWTPRIYYGFFIDEQAHIVMENIEGMTLHQWLRKEKFSLMEGKTLCAQIIVAIESLHRLSIMHRDLKPDNVIITLDGHVKIIDFGCSKGGIDGKTKCIYKIGNMCYLAPEMLVGMSYTWHVDWWAFACIVCKIFTRHTPFVHANKGMMRNKNMPATAADMVFRMLYKIPEQRLGYSGVNELMAHSFFAEIDWRAEPIRGGDLFETVERPRPAWIHGPDYWLEDFTYNYANEWIVDVELKEDAERMATVNQPRR